MGQAHCNVVNQSSHPIAVITFNMAELAFKTYNTLYIIEPGGTEKVEANPDAIGLKVGIIFDTSRDKQEMHFYKFICHNDSVLTITSCDTTDVDYYGEGTNLIGRSKLRESSVEPFNMAAETCNMELATKKVNRAAEEMKRIVTKVKDTTEDVIKTVTGKDVNLDFMNLSQHNQSNINGSTNGSTHNGDNGGMPKNVSMSSLSSATADYAHSSNNGNNNGNNSMRPSGYNNSNGNNGYNGNAPVKGQNLRPNNNPANNNVNNINNNNRFNQQSSQYDSKAIDPSDIFIDSDNTTSGNNSAGAANAQAQWTAELERAKKQQAWELEIDRIRRERAEREANAANAAQDKAFEASAVPAQSAPVVHHAGCQCIIS